MTPTIEIVLGIEIFATKTTHQTKKTKYDSDTGESYEQVDTETKYVLPDWLDKMYDREYDHGHALGTLAAFDDNASGEHFFVGRLLDMIDPQTMDPGVIEASYGARTEVLEWLRSVGCKNVLLEDVKIRLRSVWF